MADDVMGEIIPIKISGPENTPNNGFANDDAPLLWSDLFGYYRMEISCGYLTPTKGGINGRLRNIEISSHEETAPLPYTTKAGGSWNNPNVWTNGDVWDRPNSLGVDGTPIDWNIVKISSKTNLNNFASKTPLTVNENMPASKALAIMSEKKITSLLVTSENNHKKISKKLKE